MSLFDAFKTKKVEESRKEAKEAVDLLSVEYPKHPEGAVFIRMDYELRDVIARNVAGYLERMKVNLCPVLEALGMLTRENLYKYSGLEGPELKKRLREDYTAQGGSGFLFDNLVENEEYRKKFCYCARPSREYWVAISLKDTDEDEKEWYGCSKIPVLDPESLNPFFEIWISGETLEKYKEYKRLIGELNSFFELGTDRGMITAYFGNVDRNGRITENKEQIFKGGFAMHGVVRKKETSI